jgi:hypothetical protein
MYLAVGVGLVGADVVMMPAVTNKVWRKLNRGVEGLRER